MHNDKQIIERICNWHQSQLNVVLFTVVETWGSSPRPVGSMLAINSRGEFVGSVSGGCVDDDLRLRVTAGEFKRCTPHFIYYGDSTDSQRSFRLPCGGQLKLLIENQLTLPQFLQIQKNLQQNTRITRRLCLNTFESSLHATGDIVLRTDANNIWRSYGPAWRMLLIGANELSQTVAQMALMLDYQITVCEPRHDYQKNWPLQSIALNTQMPDDVVRAMMPDEQSIILALSHDPKLDDMALMLALQQPGFYIGALGSKKSSAARRQRLQTLDITSPQLARLHAPVGLDIGSHTPAEIALAILADITARRNGKSGEGTYTR